jgi:hypothetical protein
MSDTVENLILDLLEWIGPEARPYPEVMDAWKTSCPHLPVWEDANDRGYITRLRDPVRGDLIRVSPAGIEYVSRRRTDSAR